VLYRTKERLGGENLPVHPKRLVIDSFGLIEGVVSQRMKHQTQVSFFLGTLHDTRFKVRLKTFWKDRENMDFHDFGRDYRISEK